MTPGHLRPVDEVTAPDVQQLGDAVLIQGDALRALYIALHRAIRATSAAGHSPARLQAIQQQIHRALTTKCPTTAIQLRNPLTPSQNRIARAPLN